MIRVWGGGGVYHLLLEWPPDSSVGSFLRYLGHMPRLKEVSNVSTELLVDVTFSATSVQRGTASTWWREKCFPFLATAFCVVFGFIRKQLEFFPPKGRHYNSSWTISAAKLGY